MERTIVDCSTGIVTIEELTAEEVAQAEADMALTPLPEPLGQPGALAALLAATEVIDLADAANAVGVTPADLVHEVEAWAYVTAVAI